MLFVLVIDTMNSLLQHAVVSGIIRCLTQCHAASSGSLFPDDVVVFSHPDTFELTMVGKLLDLFGDISGLRTNFAKCSVVPIHCPSSAVDVIDATLNNPVSSFPMSYLGLPLSL
ncbi:hypothetical protein D1007_20405 [Hordeum vulgare]|nr:hypothetical protein D1007_20405 [Hordeum vulgare]